MTLLDRVECALEALRDAERELVRLGQDEENRPRDEHSLTVPVRYV